MQSQCLIWRARRMHIFAAQLIDWLVWRSFSKRSGNIFHQFHFHNCNMTSVKKKYFFHFVVGLVYLAIYFWWSPFKKPLLYLVTPEAWLVYLVYLVYFFNLILHLEIYRR